MDLNNQEEVPLPHHFTLDLDLLMCSPSELSSQSLLKSSPQIPQLLPPSHTQPHPIAPSFSTSNFLKNLIKLLRSWIKVSGFPSDAPEPAFRLWNALRNQRKNNKNLLALVYGEVGQNSWNIGRLLEMFNIQQQIQSIGFQQIMEAQNFLRAETIRQLTKANISYVIRNRRVQNKEQFQEFVIEFMNQLSGGEVKLKIPR